MENLYSMLNCTPDASYEELKQSYQKLALAHHPDKVMHMSEASRKTHEKHFVAIDKAWKVLADTVQRRQYDAIWHQRCLAQKWPIQEEVCFEEFEIVKLKDEAKPGQFDAASYENAFAYPCRCGGDYVLTEADAGFRTDYVCCGSCSLCIKIVYAEPSEIFNQSPA